MHCNTTGKLRTSIVSAMLRLGAATCCTLWAFCLLAQQPTEPVNGNPIDGQAYYLVNQLSGLQADLHAGSTTAGDSILLENRSFTSPVTWRWDSVMKASRACLSGENHIPS